MKHIYILLLLISFNAYSQCNHPVGISSIPRGNDVTIKWNKRSCADGYKIRYRAKGINTWKYKVVPDTNQTTIYFLNYSTDYEFAVASIDSTTTSVYSFNKTFRTLCECTAPLVVVDSIGSNAIKFLWIDDSCDVYMRIQYRISGMNSWNDNKYRDYLGEVVINNLYPNTTYEYKYKKECNNDATYTSKWSAIWTFTTDTLTNRNKFFKKINK